ncbi:MAG: hypothetical protein HC834_07735 [Rhodospirillales bacterium]|nr:hypothetical protein [Rhodospirillales bacterium]
MSVPTSPTTVFTVRATPGDPIKITKLVSYHSSNGVPAVELADRCSRTLERAEADGIEQIVEELQPPPGIEERVHA